jgi:acetyl esterase/lipase
MPVGYLVSVALVAGATLTSLIPARRPPALAWLSFRASVALNELPFAAAAFLLASTALAAGQGGLNSPGGYVGLGLAIVTTGGLAAVTCRGVRARRVLDRALQEGLGTGWRSTLDTATATRLRHHLPWARILLRPVFTRRRDVERLANLRYGDAGKRNTLDLYRHRARPSGCPVLIHLHGGAYVGGRKNSQSLPLIYRFASQGWLCVSANYRLRPTARFPAHLIDAKKVIVWVREHAHEYGGDPTVLILAGTSAGAHLTALAALTPDEPTYQPGFEQADTSVTAAVCLNGYFDAYYGNPDIPSSPLSYHRPAAPPFFVAHGDHDTVVPVERARHFVDHVRRTSANPVVYAELRGGQHAFDLFHSPRFEAVVDAIEAFAGWVRAPIENQHSEHDDSAAHNQRVGDRPTRAAQRLATATATGLRRALYPLLALPVGIACLMLILVGKHATAASLQRGLIHGLLALPFAVPSTGRVLAHSLVSLPVNLASFVLSAYVWLLLPVNLGYPLRTDTTAESLQDAWGGPTLAGAWAVHAVGGILAFLAGLPILNGLVWLQGRLAQSMEGSLRQSVT